MDMNDPIQGSPVVFLLGAGASVPAGVPDTMSFVTDFVNHLDDTDTRRTVTKVIEILKSWRNSVEGQKYSPR
jgi:NAD-dependent SIR2 family protein deacetylase